MTQGFVTASEVTISVATMACFVLARVRKCQCGLIGPGNPTSVAPTTKWMDATMAILFMSTVLLVKHRPVVHGHVKKQKVKEDMK